MAGFCGDSISDSTHVCPNYFLHILFDLHIKQLCTFMWDVAPQTTEINAIIIYNCSYLYKN
jgi:hypothetical protein